MHATSGPYQVTARDRRTHPTLTREDIGKWYILVNGSMQFVKDRYTGRKLIEAIQEDNRHTPPKPTWICYD